MTDPTKSNKAIEQDEEEELQKAIDMIAKVHEGKDAFCSRCGSKVSGRRTEKGLFIYCPKCGFIAHALLSSDSQDLYSASN
ncbi:MAG: hypothetical protein HPY71_14345 [Firmicutes bacterium]|nr:hypothetical protein [Bacillota bacterium]